MPALNDPFDLVGDVIDGQFRVDAVAGEGGLSIVYRGWHQALEAKVAIKCLNLPATLDRRLVEPFVQSFREGTKINYQLSRGNLNIAQSLASGSTLAPRTGDQVPYLVREWLEGRSLAATFAHRRAQNLGVFRIDEVIALLEGAADGLAFAHAQGVAHHSVNPSNLFVVESGGSERVKLLDFGLAKASDPALPGLRVLSPQYAAPEQVDMQLGKAGPWTDVYSLALIVMEGLFGSAVIPSKEGAAAAQVDPDHRPSERLAGLGLGKAAFDVLDRAVALEPRKRLASAGEFWSALKSALAPAPVATDGASPSVRDASKAPRPAVASLSPSKPQAASSSTTKPAVVAKPLAIDRPLASVAGRKTIVGLGADAVERGSAPKPQVLHAPSRPLSFPQTPGSAVPTPAPSPSFPAPSPSLGAAPSVTLSPNRRALPAPASSPALEPAPPPAPSSSSALQAPPAPSGSPALPAVPAPSSSPALQAPPAPSGSPLLEPTPAPESPSAATASSPEFSPVFEPSSTAAIRNLVARLATEWARLRARSSSAWTWLQGAWRSALGGTTLGPTSSDPSALGLRNLRLLVAVSVAISSASLVALAVLAFYVAGMAHRVARNEQNEGTPAATPGAQIASSPSPAPSSVTTAAPSAPSPSVSADSTATPAQPTKRLAGKAAFAALDALNTQLETCARPGGRSGPGAVWVTFDGTGFVSHIKAAPPYAGTPEGRCITDLFRGARVGPFTGPPGAIIYKFNLPASHPSSPDAP